MNLYIVIDQRFNYHKPLEDQEGNIRLFRSIEEASDVMDRKDPNHCFNYEVKLCIHNSY